MKSTDGIVDIYPGAPHADNTTDFCFVMIWRDLESLKAFVGEDYQNPHIHPDEARLVAARTITHYDLVET